MKPLRLTNKVNRVAVYLTGLRKARFNLFLVTILTGTTPLLLITAPWAKSQSEKDWEEQRRVQRDLYQSRVAGEMSAWENQRKTILQNWESLLTRSKFPGTLHKSEHQLSLIEIDSGGNTATITIASSQGRHKGKTKNRNWDKTHAEETANKFIQKHLPGLPENFRKKSQELIAEGRKKLKPVKTFLDSTYQTFQKKLPITGPKGFLKKVLQSLKSQGMGRVGPDSGKGMFTSVILDARGTPLKPTLFPRIVDAADSTLLDMTLVNPSEAIHGVAVWVKTLPEAKRNQKAGDKPLIVRAKSLGKKGEIILPALKGPESLSLKGLLFNCKTLIVTR